MKPKQFQYLEQESKVNIRINEQPQRNMQPLELQNPVQKLIKTQSDRKKNLIFWNSMVQGKIQNICSAINLLLLLLMITLGGKKYNGSETNGGWVLGWIMIAQVSFCYTVILLIKFIYLPALEREIEQNSSQGFKLYQSIQKGKKSIKTLEVSQLQVLEKTIKEHGGKFHECFPQIQLERILKQISQAYGPNYYHNTELTQVKKREKDAKYWQSFWQTFVTNKTFSIPGVMLLVLLITPHSIATVEYTSKETSNAQGWIAVGIWTAGIAIYILIKWFAWDYLNNRVEETKSSTFFTYNLINIKRKEWKNLNLAQLQDLEKNITNRREQFQECFPKENASKVLQIVTTHLKQKMPNREAGSQVQLKKIIQKQKDIQKNLTAWTTFFNARTISTIINCLKFLIVAVNTFLSYYPSSISETQNAKIAIGSVGIGAFVLGYIFYIFEKACYLDILQQRVHRGRSSPFTIYRLVYCGNKNIADLEVHQLQDILDAVKQRKQEFERCFPKISSQKLSGDIKAIIKQKLSHYPNHQNVKDLLKDQEKAKKKAAFWASFVDGHLMTSMYSVFVLLVLLVVSLASIYDGVVSIMGWIGVANCGLLIAIVIIFKAYLLGYLTDNAKALKIQGYSQFNNVYNKSKQLEQVEIGQLTKIVSIIENNPISFKACFPKAPLESTLKQIKQLIAHKTENERNRPTLTAEEEVKKQQLTLQLNRCKVALATWTSIIMERVFVITPISIVIHILWAQSIATSIYGLTVCGFLTIASLAVVLLLVCFYNFYYRQYLQEKIEQNKRLIRNLEEKKMKA